jgi:hypothetical protein
LHRYFEHGEIAHGREKERQDKKIDQAGKMSFPASDATSAIDQYRDARAAGDRKAPHLTKEQIDQAQRGDGHKTQGGE